MLCFSFIGPSGCGKDTQAELLSEVYKIPNISTGDVLRDLYERKDQLGIEAANYWLDGHWVPDELMTLILEKQLNGNDCKNGFILNGYPRTFEQVQIYDSELNSKFPLNAVVYFDLSDEEAVKRLSNRRVCPKCGDIYHLIFKPSKDNAKCDSCDAILEQREDDKKELILERLASFRKSIEDILNFYENKNLLIKIDAAPSIKEIHQTLKQKIRTYV